MKKTCLSCRFNWSIGIALRTNHFCLFIDVMSEKDIQNLIEQAESQIDAGVTAEDAIKTFVSASIMEVNGEYTAPYKQLLVEDAAE